MYAVYDNGKPAELGIHTSFDKYTFSTFAAALIYARKWLGPSFGGSEDGKNGVILELNKAWDYSGFGDTIEIRSED